MIIMINDIINIDDVDVIKYWYYECEKNWIVIMLRIDDYIQF